MKKMRITMCDGSEFTVFFLNKKHEKQDNTNPTVILNPELHADFIKEMTQDQEIFESKQEMKKNSSQIGSIFEKIIPDFILKNKKQNRNDWGWG
jgi:hypothetical protein